MTWIIRNLESSSRGDAVEDLNGVEHLNCDVVSLFVGKLQWMNVMRHCNIRRTCEMLWVAVLLLVYDQNFWSNVFSYSALSPGSLDLELTRRRVVTVKNPPLTSAGGRR